MKPEIKLNEVEASPFYWRGKRCETAEYLKGIGKAVPRKPFYGSIDVPKRTILAHFEPVKQKPGVGAMRTV